jgi:GDP-L-fucose synthase
MRIFLAGHRGLVGSTIHKILKNTEHEIVVRTHKELDLSNQALVNDFFAKEKFDQVYLAAAKVGGVYSNNVYPADFIYHNLMIQTNVIHACHVNDVQKLLMLGSNCIYPRVTEQPIKEHLLMTGHLEPTNEPYAIAKIAGVKMCESYNRQYGRDYRSVLPCNLYGPYDKFDIHQAHLIPSIISKIDQAIANDEKTVEIWGDGTARREFMYVGDLTDLIYKAINKFESLPSMMNVGLGFDHSVLDYYAATAQVMGWSGNFSFNLNKPVGMKRKLLNVKHQKIWGWESKTSLDDGINLTVQYYKESSNVF